MDKDIDISKYEIKFELPDFSKDGFIFGLNEDDDGMKLGVPNPEVWNHLKSWIDLIKKQENNKDEWFELPWFPNYKFLNLRVTSKPFSDDEISDSPHTIHFTYDSKIYKEIEINLDK